MKHQFELAETNLDHAYPQVKTIFLALFPEYPIQILQETPPKFFSMNINDHHFTIFLRSGKTRITVVLEVTPDSLWFKLLPFLFLLGISLGASIAILLGLRPVYYYGGSILLLLWVLKWDAPIDQKFPKLRQRFAMALRALSDDTILHPLLPKPTVAELIRALATHQSPYQLLDLCDALVAYGEEAKTAVPVIKSLRERFRSGEFGKYEEWRSWDLEARFQLILNRIDPSGLTT